jgi:hypothetical protein
MWWLIFTILLSDLQYLSFLGAGCIRFQCESNIFPYRLEDKWASESCRTVPKSSIDQKFLIFRIFSVNKQFTVLSPCYNAVLIRLSNGLRTFTASGWFRQLNFFTFSDPKVDII